MIAPLFVTSSYSFLFGPVQPQALVERAAALGYEAVALTDRNSVTGIPTFVGACKDAHIRPIVGTELRYPGGRALLLARDRQGFARLSNILTARADGTFDARGALLQDHGGIVVITDDVGLLASAAKGPAEPGRDFYALLSPCNRALWRRLRRSGCPCVATGEVCFLAPADRDTQRVLLAIAGNKTVAEVNEREKASAEAVLVGPQEFAALYAEIPEALSANATVVESAAFSRLASGFVFPSYQTDEPGGPAALLRRLVLEGAARRYSLPLTEKIRDRIDHELAIITQKSFSDYFLVVRDIARRSSRTCGRGSAAASIVSYCLGITDVDPIRYDLYFERFLNPAREDPPDIDIDFAWDERDALFESVVASCGEDRAARVANHICFKERAALRETALAFGMSEPEIEAFERRCGAASRATSAHTSAQAAARQSPPTPTPAGKRGLPYRENSTQAPHPGTGSVSGRPGDGSETGISESDVAEDADGPWAEIKRLYPRLIGLPRNLGVHSGGLIVVPDRLADHLPLERTGGGIRVVVWDKEGVEDAGLVKIDLLGNRSLAVVRDALSNLAENGTPIDENSWHPTEDQATIDLLARGDTMGVFYVESPAMRLLQQKTGRGDFEHLVIHSSMIRPAANRYINEYVDRLNGKPWEPLHPLLADLFAESFGILCYQEDTSKAAVALADFSATEADGIRKALAKKDPEAWLRKYWPAFEAGARANNVGEVTIRAVWDMILSFCGYSFVKAHSASYAMLSFRSAYLRRHHPAEFMAAVISNHGGFYSTLAYVSECRRMGLDVLAPDVNRSELRCRGFGRTMLLGLEMIASLRLQTACAIVEERRSRGRFYSIENLARRVPCSRADAEALAGSGALDSVAESKLRATALMEFFGILARQEAAGNSAQTASLFAEDETAPPPAESAKNARPASMAAPQASEATLPASMAAPPGSTVPPQQSAAPQRPEAPFFGFSATLDPHPSATEARAERKRLESEMKYLGTTLAVHPIALWPAAAKRPRIRGSELHLHIGETVNLLGWPIVAKQVLTASEQPMEFVSFEDETALYETVLFPECYRRYHGLLFEERPLFIRGKVENDRGAITVAVASIEACR